ncbi:hypothetical protein NM208_g9020 [Fusarium decemcellulare]|uniref:Uncharacterized protein n=1 Tax=Fusarium decemcellulare TaxID=57161 RepID=A0ACC1S3C5_9HYPO|nr:hypothetical protein NM208_g9020 [Fusarium decemcellulare]
MPGDDGLENSTTARVTASRNICPAPNTRSLTFLFDPPGFLSDVQNFVNDPAMFRSQLGHYGALISGSFALGFFRLTYKEVQRLDVFLEDGSGADEFASYLQETEKYQSDSQEVETTPRRRIYSRVLRPNMKLCMIRTTGPPTQDILTSPSTTAYVNFITWNKAFSIFPRQTLIEHRFYPLKPLGNDFGVELNELASQGWTARDILWPDYAEDKLSGLVGVRRVGDGLSMVIPLDTNSVSPPWIPNYVIECAQFDICDNGPRFGKSRTISSQFGRAHIANRAPPWSFIQIRAKELRSPALHYSYTTGSTKWHDFVGERVRRWAWLELYKIEERDRPVQSSTSFPLVSEISIPQGFETPRSWDYADDQMPAWYQEWERK